MILEELDMDIVIFDLEDMYQTTYQFFYMEVVIYQIYHHLQHF